ncbi:hypothetical protein F5887DRAFT_1081471 [Amanita rubescens]|nr:hypothetical protein F5887DRAFT_1081471 [Amanita rubescens]
MPKTTKQPERFRPAKNGRRPVLRHLDHLCLFYVDPRAIHFGFDRWKASEIRIYAHKSNKFFLMASLHNEDVGEIHLRIKRRFLDPEGREVAVRSVRRRNCAPAKSNEVALKIALDEISLIPPSFRDHASRLIHHVKFKNGQHIPLARLIVLVWTIKHYLKARTFTNKNSYWLCYAIGEALKKCYDHSILTPLPPSVQRRRTLVEVIDVDDLLRNYDDMWDGSLYKIHSIVSNPCSKRFIGAKEAERSANAERHLPGFVASLALKRRRNKE